MYIYVWYTKKQSFERIMFFMKNKEEKEFDLAVILTITTLKLFVPVRDFLKALK